MNAHPDTAPPRSQAPCRLAVVIVNYRTPELVLDCATSLATECDPALDVVVLVDNASDDGSADRLRAAPGRASPVPVRLLLSPHNGGLGAGINLGVGAVRARAYLILNSDTFVRAGAIERLLSVLDEEPSIGLVAPRLEWPDETPQESCFRCPSPWSELVYAAGTGPIRRLLGRWDVPLPVSSVRMEPEWASFAALLVRGEVFDRIGGMDERFFLFFEDVDFCSRARRAGWRLVYEPRARVVHLRGKSTPVKALAAERKRLPRYYYEGRSYYFRKHHGRLGLLAANLGWTVGHTVARLREGVGSKQPHAAQHALLDTWRG
jgi:N-acetylglucosaminyl-diphospho-decaprenol L-rhamnosyltransferase